MFMVSFNSISRVAIVGYGICNDSLILNKVMKIFRIANTDVFNIDISNTKIVVTFKEKISNNLLDLLHNELFD